MKKLFIFLCTLVLLYGLTYFGLDYWSKKELEKVTANWPVLHKDLSELSTALPATEDNQTTWKIRKIYKQLKYKITVEGKPKDAAMMVSSYLTEQRRKQELEVKDRRLVANNRREA